MKINLKYCFILSVLLLLLSCDELLFEDPQPNLIKNQYIFPKEFIGTWFELEDTQVQEALFVTKYNAYWYTFRNDVSILKKEVDTSSKHLIYKEKIYEINPYEEILLSQGFPYQIRNDSVYYEYKTKHEIVLSRLNFIRKVDDMYILNMKNEKNWYYLILFYLNNKNQLIVRGLNSNDAFKLNQDNIIFKKYKGEGSVQLFSNQQFDKQALVKFIQQGGFSDTLMHLTKKDIL